MELVTQYDDEKTFLRLGDGHMFLSPIVDDYICKHTKISTGKDTGYKDKYGNTIYENSLLLDTVDSSIVMVTSTVTNGKNEYLISSFCYNNFPITPASLQVIGIQDDNKEYHFYICDEDDITKALQDHYDLLISHDADAVRYAKKYITEEMSDVLKLFTKRRFYTSFTGVNWICGIAHLPRVCADGAILEDIFVADNEKDALFGFIKHFKG